MHSVLCLERESGLHTHTQIGEKRIRAHKCILASRCVYFAAMLSGHWVESAGNVIKLQGYVYVCIYLTVENVGNFISLKFKV